MGFFRDLGLFRGSSKKEEKEVPRRKGKVRFLGFGLLDLPNVGPTARDSLLCVLDLNPVENLELVISMPPWFCDSSWVRFVYGKRFVFTFAVLGGR